MIAEQRKQMQQQQTTSSDGRSSPVAMDTGLLRTPKVDLVESMEEKALKKEQVNKINVNPHWQNHLYQSF